MKCKAMVKLKHNLNALKKLIWTFDEHSNILFLYPVENILNIINIAQEFIFFDNRLDI